MKSLTKYLTLNVPSKMAFRNITADVSEFMTLFPGDVLLTGVPEDAPLARVGEIVRIDIEGIGQLQNMLVAQRDWASGAPA